MKNLKPQDIREGQPPASMTSFVAQRPIFDFGGHAWGYELSFRNAGDPGPGCPLEHDKATGETPAEVFPLSTHYIGQEKTILVNLPAEFLLGSTPPSLPPAPCVLGIRKISKTMPEIIDTCSKLRESGYSLAFDEDSIQDGGEELIALAHIIKVGVMDRYVDNIARTVNMLKPHGCLLLAERIEDDNTFSLAKSLGFSLFQGSFFTRPTILPGRKIPAKMIAKVKLLKELAGEDHSIKNIVKIIGQDAELSGRLQRYLNSADFLLPSKVDSLVQAVTLLTLQGYRPLRQWLMSVMISDMTGTTKNDELAYVSLQRAHFLQAVGKFAPSATYPAETMFMLGLFSKLDALLSIPMSEITGLLPLDESISRAYLGEVTPATTWLKLLEALENADFDAAMAALAGIGIRPDQAAQEYALAAAKASDTLRINSGRSN